MTTRPSPDIPVTSDAELTERLRALLELDGPPGRRSLFLTWIRADGTMVPLVIPIEDVPVEPDRVAIGNIVGLHETVAEAERVDASQLHLAMLLERRGPAALSADDHAWHSAVEAIVRDRDGIDCSMHVGNGRTVVPVLPRTAWPVN